MSKKKRAKMQENTQPVILHPLNKPAFTLAEVLITLGIIGVVASMTIPTLMTNVSNRQFETGAKKTEATLIQALLMMKANNALVGHGTTENFVNELKNYLKIAKTCESSNLSGCYPEEFTAGEETVKLNEIISSKSLGHEDWNTHVQGFVLNNGQSFLATYNPGCTNDDYKGCAGFVYDMNSIEKTNVFTGSNGESDLGSFNAVFSTGLDCGTNAVWASGRDETDQAHFDQYGFYPEYAGFVMDGTDGKTEACVDTNWEKIKQACIGWEDYITEDTVDRYLAKYTYGLVTVGYCWCFPQGTVVTMADGSQKRIEDIDYDDDLLVWDFDNAKMSSSKPVWLMKPQVTTKYNILTFSDGSELRTVKRHRIFNKEEGRFTYTMEDETPLGTTTLNAKGEEVTLISKEVVEEPVVYYNLITANHFNCFTSNILTSNRFNNLYPIVDYKFVKDNRELTPYSEYENFVSRDWYEKLRLAEQTCDEDMKLYLSNLVRLNKRQLALV